MKVKKIADFFPFFGMLVASAVTMCIYLFAMNGRELVHILQVIIAPLVTLVIPVLNRIFKIRIPLAFNIAVAVFSLFAINFASVLYFYGLIPYYDKILHTTFGIVGSFGVFILLLYGKGEKLSPWCIFILIMLCVLGVAAIWEIYEYIASAIIGSDMQHWVPEMSEVGSMTVEEFFKSGYDPLWDTIWDVIVAGIGVVIFYIIILIDKFCGYKLCKSIYRQVQVRPKKDKPQGAENAPSADEKSREEQPPAETE